MTRLEKRPESHALRQGATNGRKKIRVLLAGFPKIMRSGVRGIMESQSDTEVLDMTDVNDSLIQQARELRPDVIVVDIHTSQLDYIGLSRRVLAENPDTRIVVLPVHLHMAIIEQAVRAGISGFVTKECGFDELTNAVRAVHENRTYVCSEIWDFIAEGFLKSNALDARAWARSTAASR